MTDKKNNNCKCNECIYGMKVNELKEVNQELYILLESIYNQECELDDYSILKEIYSLLSDEVDDEEYYDLAIDEDCDDLIDILFEYCTTFQVDKSKLAIQLGKYCTQPEKRHFESYEDFHTAIANALKQSCTIDDNGNSSFLCFLLNDIISEDIKLKNEMLERKNKADNQPTNYFNLF